MTPANQNAGPERRRQSLPPGASTKVPMTISKATVVNNSGELAPPIARNSGPHQIAAAAQDHDDRGEAFGDI